jgi:Dna[CI] antecedent, DciA
MEGMRELLGSSLGRTLEAMADEDRLAAAWPVACGKALSERGRVVGYADGVVVIEVKDSAWLQQMMSMRGQLTGEMARIARVKVREIHFEVKGQKKKKDDRR